MMILLSLIDYSKEKKKFEKRLEDNYPIDLDQYRILEFDEGVKRFLGLFIATFIAIWAVGVLI